MTNDPGSEPPPIGNPHVPPPVPPRLPSAPPKESSAFFKSCAIASWLSLVICIVVNVALQGATASMPRSREMALMLAAVPGLFLLVGIGAGIIGLCGIRRHGRKGLLGHSLTGLILWLLLAALAVPTFRAAQAKARAAASLRRPTVLQPVQHSPGAKLFQDTDLGISFDIPGGFEAVDAAKLPAEFKSGFVMPGAQGNSFLLVKALGKAMPWHTHVHAANLPRQLIDKGVTVETTNWRGVEVDCFRVPEEAGGLAFLTFNVQIPLRKQTVQLSISGPRNSEEEVRARITKVLQSLDGESEW